jgi:hypothetical protein
MENQAPERPLLAGLVLWNWARSRAELHSLKSIQEIRCQNFCCPQAWFSQAELAAQPLNCVPWSPCKKSDHRSAACRFGSTKPAAVLLNCASWSPYRKSGPRAPALRRLGFSTPVFVVPGSSAPVASKFQASHCLKIWVPFISISYHGSWKTTPHSNRPQGLHCLMDTRWFKPAGFAAPQFPQLATQCQEPATTHLNETQATGFALLLAPGGFPPQKAWRPLSLRVRALATLSKSKNTRFPTEGRKAITC